MYSNIGVIFCETVPLKKFFFHLGFPLENLAELLVEEGEPVVEPGPEDGQELGQAPRVQIQSYSPAILPPTVKGTVSGEY